MAEQEQEQLMMASPKNGKTVIKLSRYLVHGDDEITELSLRHPKVDDVADIGYPFTIASEGGETRIELKPKAVLKYLSRLAAVPPSVLKDMAIKDFMLAQRTIQDFFEATEEIPPS